MMAILVDSEICVEQLENSLCKQEKALEAYRVENFTLTVELTAELQAVKTSLLECINQSQSFGGGDRSRVAHFEPNYQSSPVSYTSQVAEYVALFSSLATPTPARRNQINNYLDSASCGDGNRTTPSTVS